jgi:hypothetical protein
MGKEEGTSLVKVLEKILERKTEKQSPLESHRQHCQRANCWPCSKEKILFQFELVLLPVLCIAAVCVIFFASSLIIKGGAAVALWGVVRAITKHITNPA